MEKNVKNALVSAILSALGESVIRIILYGSVARETQTDESDIDVAVIIKENLSENEKNALLNAIVELDLAYDKVFSVIDIKGSDYDSWKEFIPFYKNVSKEGVVLWKAA